jgi:hypothetical protein
MWKDTQKLVMVKNRKRPFKFSFHIIPFCIVGLFYPGANISFTFKKCQQGWMLVAHVYNPSYLGG